MSTLKKLQSRLNLERAQYRAIKDSDLFEETEKAKLLPQLEIYVTHTCNEIENHPDYRKRVDEIIVHGAVEVTGRARV